MLVIIRKPEKKLVWLGSTYSNLREFPRDARRQAGQELNAVQQGEMPDDWKPIKSVGPGALEIRIHYPNEYRVIYVAKFPEAIYVLHAFLKKSEKTLLKDLITARTAYGQIENIRKKD